MCSETQRITVKKRFKSLPAIEPARRREEMRDRVKYEIAIRLQAIRERLGYTLRQFETLVGLSRSSLSRIEVNECCSIKRLLHITIYLHLHGLMAQNEYRVLMVLFHCLTRCHALTKDDFIGLIEQHEGVKLAGDNLPLHRSERAICLLGDDIEGVINYIKRYYCRCFIRQKHRLQLTTKQISEACFISEHTIRKIEHFNMGVSFEKILDFVDLLH